MVTGKLITFEGVEGCGKTTQIELCRTWLESLDIPVITTREPGGTALGTTIRRLLLDNSDNKPCDTTELLLYAADRAQHVEEVIKPALTDGKFILCDRFTDSTVAYQGYGRKFPLTTIDKLNKIATAGITPDLTIWLDVDIEVGFTRKHKESPELDRIEQESLDFHRRVQQGYAELANLYPSRIVRIDGSQGKESVFKDVLSAVLFIMG